MELKLHYSCFTVHMILSHCHSLTRNTHTEPKPKYLPIEITMILIKRHCLNDFLLSLQCTNHVYSLTVIPLFVVFGLDSIFVAKTRILHTQVNLIHSCGLSDKIWFHQNSSFYLNDAPKRVAMERTKIKFTQHTKVPNKSSPIFNCK